MATTPGDKTADVKLKPGERRSANGVILGAGADPEIPAFGGEEPAPDWAAFMARPFGT